MTFMILYTKLLITVLTLFCIGCTEDNETVAQNIPETSNTKMNITINGKTMTVALVDNSATKKLVELLKDSPITYQAEDYGGFEKVGYLGHSLPTSNSQITTEAGDVILYSGNQIVLFYGSNSWSYTRLGRIEYSTMDELKDFLQAGKGDVTVKLSLAGTTSVKTANLAHHEQDEYVSLSGIPTNHPRKGVYIKNGKKYLK